MQLVSTVGGALVAQRLRRKGPVIAALCVAPIAGCYVLMTTPRSPERKATLLLGYYLISVYPGMSTFSLCLSLSPSLSPSPLLHSS